MVLDFFESENFGEIISRLKRTVIVVFSVFISVGIFGSRWHKGIPYPFPDPNDSFSIIFFNTVRSHIVPQNVDLMVYHPLQPLEGVFYAVLLLTLIISMPYIAYQLVSFVSPALYKSEKKEMIKYVIPISILFTSGVLFCYYLILPPGLYFMYKFGSFLGATSFITITGLIKFSIITMAVSGLAFQLPILMVMLSKFGIIDYETWMSQLKVKFGLIFLVLIFMPGGIIESGMIYLPVVGLYIMGAFISKKVSEEEVKR